MLLPDSYSKSQTRPQISHLRQTASTRNKQIKRATKFPDKENNQYFTLKDCSKPETQNMTVVGGGG